MNELQPLLDSSEIPRTRELLRAGRADVPGHGYSERLLVGLGLGVAASTVSVVAAAGTAGAALQGAASTGVGLMVAKWVAVGVIGGGILASGAEVAFAPRSAEPVASVAAKAAATPPSPVQTAARAAPAAVTTAEREPEPAPPAVASERQPAAASAAVASAQPVGLGREVEAIARTRSALASGDLARALKELNAFERIQSTGVLAREAKVLRIEVLYRLGQTARARQLFEAYSRIYPSDTHAARLRAFDPGKE